MLRLQTVEKCVVRESSVAPVGGVCLTSTAVTAMMTAGTLATKEGVCVPSESFSAQGASVSHLRECVTDTRTVPQAQMRSSALLKVHGAPSGGLHCLTS